MKRRAITMDQLHAYCKAHDIIVPATARRDELEAAITRAALHLTKVETNPEHGCFGFWMKDDMNCRVCRFEEPCSEVSLGTTPEKSERYVERMENPRLRFTEALRKKPRGKKP